MSLVLTRRVYSSNRPILHVSSGDHSHLAWEHFSSTHFRLVPYSWTWPRVRWHSDDYWPGLGKGFWVRVIFSWNNVNALDAYHISNFTSKFIFLPSPGHDTQICRMTSKRDLGSSAHFLRELEVLLALEKKYAIRNVADITVMRFLRRGDWTLFNPYCRTETGSF